MSLPNALAGRRLWLLGVASLAALLALAVAALGPLQQRASADGHELPPNLAFNLQLIEDSDNIVPAGSELTVRATVSYSGPALGTDAPVEARAADKAGGAGAAFTGAFGATEGVLRVSGSFEWESESSTGSRLNLPGVGFARKSNAGIDQAADAIGGRDSASGDPVLTTSHNGAFRAVAWDGRTLIGYSYGSTNADGRSVQIIDMSTDPPTWRDSVSFPESGRRAEWHRWGSGFDINGLTPGFESIAVWQEDNDTAWLFIGAKTTLQGYTSGTEGAGAVYIYRLSYAANGDVTVTLGDKMQPLATENTNRPPNKTGYWAGYANAGGYGSSVSVSADGSTLVVGAPRMNNVGAIYVYTRPATGWSAVGSTITGANFYAAGVKVSVVAIPTWGTMSNNAHRPFNTGAAAGCAAGSWCAQVGAQSINSREPLAGSSGQRQDLEGVNFGIGKIGISADGSVIAVGAPTAQFDGSATAGGSFTGGVDNGAVYVFEAPAGGWDSATDVSADPDGSGPMTARTLFATGSNASTFALASHYSAGPVKRIVSPTATLRPTATWTSTAGDAENFGVHVDVSDDGSTIAVSSGGPGRSEEFGDWAAKAAAYVFERGGSSWGDATSADATITLGANREYAPWGFDLNPAGDTLVFGQRTYNSNAGRAVVIKKGDGWADAEIDIAAAVSGAGRWQLAQPAFDGVTAATRFGVPVYNADGGQLVISAPGIAATGDNPGSVWNWHVPTGDAPCTSRTLDDLTTNTCGVAIPDMGKVVIPNGSPDGAFTISGSVKLTRGGDDSTVRDTLEVTVGKVDEVASVSIGVAPDLKDPTTSNDDTTYPTVLRASGAKTRLQLKILNSGGKATAAGNLASVLVTSTGGRLSLVSAADAPNNATSTSCADLSCQITTSSINAGNAANILLQLEHNNRPTTARISVQVLSSSGTSLRAEPLEITLAGPAETISVAEPIVGVLNVDQVGSDDDGNDVDTATGATQDELLLAVSAKDAGGNTVAVPRATSGRVTVSDPDGNRVRSGITATFPARKNPGENITTGCTTTSTDGSGGTCPGAAAGDPRRDATSADNPAIVTSAGLFQVKIDVDAAASSPLKGGEYTVTVTSGGKTGMAKFNVSGGPAATGFDLMGPEGRQAVGSQFTVEATVNDAEGNPVPDGTVVTWYDPTETSGAGRATLAVSIDAVTRTKDGKASNTYLVVGAGSIYIRAIAGAGADVVTVQLGGAPVTAEPANPADSLSSRNPDAYTTWRGEGRTSAADLLAGLDNISSVLLWLNGEWLRYGVVDGVEIPGSRDFTVNPGQVLWLSR